MKFFPKLGSFSNEHKNGLQKKVMLPAKHLGWLGLSYSNVSKELKRYGVDSTKGPDYKKSWNQKELQTSPRAQIPEDAIYYAVAVEAEKASFDAKLEYIESTEYWRNRLAAICYQVDKDLVTENVNLVVIMQGYEPINACMRFAAINKGIPILALENTALTTRFIWDNVAGITTNKNLAKNFYWKYRGVFSREEIKRFSENFKDNLRFSKSAEHATPISSGKISARRPLVVFLAQVLTDSSIVFGLGKWSSPFSLMEDVCEWCNKAGYQLLIKLHPKELHGKNPINRLPYDRLTYRKIQDDNKLRKILDNNDAIVDKDNLYDTFSLIQSAKFVVTINSQSGLEAALLGTPVVVAGEAFYHGLGFTLDASDPRFLSSSLDDAASWIVPEIAAEFGYIFFEHYCRPKTSCSLAALIADNF